MSVQFQLTASFKKGITRFEPKSLLCFPFDVKNVSITSDNNTDFHATIWINDKWETGPRTLCTIGADKVVSLYVFDFLCGPRADTFIVFVNSSCNGIFHVDLERSATDTTLTQRDVERFYDAMLPVENDEMLISKSIISNIRWHECEKYSIDRLPQMRSIEATQQSDLNCNFMDVVTHVEITCETESYSATASIRVKSQNTLFTFPLKSGTHTYDCIVMIVGHAWGVKDLYIKDAKVTKVVFYGVCWPLFLREKVLETKFIIVEQPNGSAYAMHGGFSAPVIDKRVDN